MPSHPFPFTESALDCNRRDPQHNSIYLRVIGKSESAGLEVEFRTTRLVRRGDGDSTVLPFMRRIRRRAARRPFSTIGWRTVVSGGLVHAEAGTSSNPTTDRSSGTRSPADWAADITPMAAMSLIASTPVGRRLPFGIDSNARAPAGTEIPATTTCGSGAPAARIACWYPANRRPAVGVLVT